MCVTVYPFGHKILEFLQLPTDGSPALVCGRQKQVGLTIAPQQTLVLMNRVFFRVDGGEITMPIQFQHLSWSDDVEECDIPFIMVYPIGIELGVKFRDLLPKIQYFFEDVDFPHRATMGSYQTLTTIQEKEDIGRD